jgi:hypothetical protein
MEALIVGIVWLSMLIVALIAILMPKKPVVGDIKLYNRRSNGVMCLTPIKDNGDHNYTCIDDGGKKQIISKEALKFNFNK